MWKTILSITLLTISAAAVAVELNQASVADLDGIKGVGPAVSSRILDERKKGEFKDWADFIKRVKGIGRSNAARFSSGGLVVNGAAYQVTVATTPLQAASLAPASGKPKH